MFLIRQRGSTVGREVLGGLTTFMAMSYIIFVQVAVLGNMDINKDGVPDMDPGGVMMATCLSAALSSILMGLWANYPVALAPGMGENVFFVLVLAPALAAYGTGQGWQMALALTLVPGIIILLLTTVGFRKYILDMIPNALKSGIAAGIGLFIAVIGFNEANLVGAGGALLVLKKLQNNPAAWLALAVLAITLTLMAFRIRGAILLGILGGAVIAGLMHKLSWPGWPVAWPGGLEKTAGGFVPGFESLWQALPSHWVDILVFLFILLLMDLFDSVGTLVGVAQRAGLIRDGKLPKANQALAADAVGTVVGAGLGASTVTSYIESVTGVAAGARTGLAAIVTGVLMVLAMFFGPVVKMIGGGVAVDDGPPKHPLIAPAMIIVGSMMLRVVRDLEWDDVTEYLPAFLTMITMPLAYSISDGIAIGFVTYAFAKLVSGRAKECPAAVYVFAVVFVIRYAWIAG